VENVHRLENMLNRKAKIHPNGWLWSISLNESNYLRIDESKIQGKINESRHGGGILKRRQQ
jgi:hypothetical protein